ncbi:hypothetical protein [Pantoea agglomerans]|uniref:hypothetical protein n=1 Tax=Enterobacter agglomerans TaxID=549 RepID=UPI00320B6303
MIETLDFYMTQATPELLEGRREYIERVIVGKLKRGIKVMQAWSQEFASQPDAQLLITAYNAALEFFTVKGFNTN